MKLSLLLLTLLLIAQSQAQTNLPKTFKEGELILLDSSHLKGFIKENCRKDASIEFMADARGKKKRYQGNELIAVSIASEHFLCLQGDFFELICDGELAFLRKISNASSIPVYIGTEVVFPYGTEGKPDDFFIYEKKTKLLKWVSTKNIKELTANLFKGYSPSIVVAEKAYVEIPKLKEAIEMFNRREIKD